MNTGDQFAGKQWNAADNPDRFQVPEASSGQRLDIFLAAQYPQVSRVRIRRGIDDWQRPSALVVGGEANGPSDLALSIAHPISIPMHGHVDSLNVAMAGTVILFEAARQRRLALRDVDGSGTHPSR